MLSRSLQESILALLAFNDQGRLIHALLQPSDFDRAYYAVADKIIEFWHTHQEPPNKHLDDLLGDVLEKGDARANITRKLILNLFNLSKDINVNFVVNSTTKFIKTQRLKSAIIEAADILASGDKDADEKVERILANAQKICVEAFNPGIFFSDAVKYIRIAKEAALFPLGIEALDKEGLGIRRGHVLLFVAASKRGKSWFANHCAIQALIQGLKIVYVTLEISAEEMINRLTQRANAISTNNSPICLTEFTEDGLHTEEYHAEASFADPDKLEKFLEKRMSKDELLGRLSSNLLVKKFPSGYLSEVGLTNYLENLEYITHFVPDVLIIDYPDLMKNPGGIKDHRLGLGEIYKYIHGLATERNIGIITLTQGTRASGSTELVTDEHVGEDYSKVQTVDTVLTYSQTRAEARLGLARIYVSNSRVGKDKFIVAISQAYGIGQFKIDEILLTDDRAYDRMLQANTSSD